MTGISEHALDVVQSLLIENYTMLKPLPPLNGNTCPIWVTVVAVRVV